MADDGTRYPFNELGTIQIVNDRLYQHGTMRLNYITYDLRCDYDIINPQKHANVMAVSPLFDPISNTAEDGHPFAYARVLGIYHTDVVHIDAETFATSAHTVELVLVHWYQRDLTYNAGFRHRRLHRLRLTSVEDAEAFGFLDPDDIIRGCHLIPAFAHGRPDNGLMPALEPEESNGPLWNYYYVNW